MAVCVCTVYPLWIDKATMRLEDLQRQFEVPLYAFDFAGLAEMLESISSEPVPARGPQATTIGA